MAVSVFTSHILFAFLLFLIFVLVAFRIHIKADRRFREAQLRFSEIFESSRDAIAYVDLKGVLVDCNSAFLKLTGYSKDELLGRKKYPELTAPEYHEYEDEIIKRILETGQPQDYEKEYIRKDERRIPVELTTFLVKKPGGKPDGLAAVIRDIGEHRRLEQEIRDTAELKSKFASIVSHELRTPLSIINESVNFMREGLVGHLNAEQRRLLDISKENIDRLIRLINEFLDFKKMEAGMMRFNFEENDINDAVKEVYRIMHILTEQKGLYLKLELKDVLPKIRFDRDKIAEVLVNLINNAIKFTKKGGVTIMTERRDNAIEVLVHDTGIGLKSEDMDKIFVAFEQIEPATGQDRGTGLGLIISKEIIEGHKGKIWVESDYGKSTTFHFLLPIKEQRGSLK